MGFQHLWLLFCDFLLLSSERVQASALRLRWVSLAIGAVSSVLYLWLSFQPVWNQLVFGDNLLAFKALAW